MRILIIEDETELAQTIADSLRIEQFLVDTVHHFEPALRMVEDYRYDCIILDLNLPGGHGLDILKTIKKQGYPDAVIIVSARNALDDKLTGLDIGADDYLTKPFHMPELHARIRSVLRRKNFDGDTQIHWQNITVDPDQKRVLVQDTPLHLVRKEWDIFLFLLSNKNRVVTRTALAEHVWGNHTDQADNLDFVYSQIKNLRKKLKDSGAQMDIQAVYGLGYKLIPT